MIRTMVVALAFAAAAWTPAHAQDSERQRLALEVMQLMEMEKTLGDFFVAMSPVIASATAAEARLTPAQTTRLGELIAEEFRVETPTLVRELAAVYAERMDEAQLRDVAAFFRSPAGVAFLQAQNGAQVELERIGQRGGMRVGARAVERLVRESQRPPPQL